MMKFAEDRYRRDIADLLRRIHVYESSASPRNIARVFLAFPSPGYVERSFSWYSPFLINYRYQACSSKCQLRQKSIRLVTRQREAEGPCQTSAGYSGL
jgi:hypothetical protein